MHGSDLESFYKMVPRHLMPKGEFSKNLLNQKINKENTTTIFFVTEYGGDLYTINGMTMISKKNAQ